ncbi:hypothetical protein [Alteromonas sp. H39]|uniref:hypothetical protein n=1 Tax=Alteromonas sp. H39 TaxID=3389876 RepID=UPI0039E124CF
MAGRELSDFLASLNSGKKVTNSDARLLTHQLSQEALRITLGQNVWIGPHATILAGETIHDGAIVATGAVVRKDVQPNTIVRGGPAKYIKDVSRAI